MADAIISFLSMAAEAVITQPISQADHDAANERILSSYVVSTPSSNASKTSKNVALDLGPCLVGPSLRDSGALHPGFRWQDADRDTSLPAGFVGSGTVGIDVNATGATAVGVAILQDTRGDVSISCHEGALSKL